MALVTFSGYPASGKSTRAQQLASFLSQRLAEDSNPSLKRLKVVVINDESLFLSKSAYDGQSIILRTVPANLS